jgi:GNAT superfamily N-acetyltransferase
VERALQKESQCGITKEGPPSSPARRRAATTVTSTSTPEWGCGDLDWRRRLSSLKLVTAAERPDLVEEMRRLGASPWPEFLDHGAVVNAHWRLLYELVPDYQFALLDEETGSPAVIGNSIPIRWDGDPATLPARGIDAVLEDGVACLREGAAPTAASALMIVVVPDRLGKGISASAVRAMADVARRHGLSDLVAPVRATEKHRYPLIPMERYIGWRRDDGWPFDPWIRVHERVGAEILGAAPEAMRVTGSVSDWERWTSMAFPETGSYVVPGALVPVAIDRERDLGDYREPACWMRHRIASS